MSDKNLRITPEEVNEINDQVDHITFWNDILDQLKLKLPKASFDTWFSNTTLVPFDYNDIKLLIEVPNEFGRDWLKGRYNKLVSETVYNVTGKEYHIEFIVSPDQTLKNQHEPLTITRNETVDKKLDEILAKLEQLNERVSNLESKE